MPCSGKDDLEVVVVGAGAAGIGAAMRLAAARVSFTVLEARNRVAGRAYTSADAPFPLDLGCGWLHPASARLRSSRDPAPGRCEILGTLNPLGRHAG
jgi:cation diffusion facilitator CzcD-associated flavoprotein CzcO